MILDSFEIKPIHRNVVDINKALSDKSCNQNNQKHSDAKNVHTWKEY